MQRARCPGQDTRYWTPDDIFEVPCAHCGKPLEFFKDDLRRRCPVCGQPAVNPKNDMACAAWCQWAEECLSQLGRTPEQRGPRSPETYTSYPSNRSDAA